MTIQTNEDFTHSLLEQTKTMVLGFDLETRLLYSNQYAQDVLGYTASELSAVPFNTRVINHRKAAFAQAVLKAQTEGSAAIDLMLRRKNGSQCTISGVLSRWQHEDGIHVAFFGVEALRESDDMSVTTLLHSLPGFAHRCLNDPEWTTLFITEGVTEITGYPVSDFVQNSVRTYNSIIHPEDQPRDWEETQIQLRSNRYFETRYRIITASGEERWVWDYGRGIYDENDKIVALEGLIVDITQQKHIETALLQSEQRYSTLLESIPDLMFRANGEGKFLDFKPSTKLLVSPDQILGKKITDILPQDVAARSMEAIEHTLKTGEISLYEYQLPVGSDLEDFEARVAFINTNEVFCIVRDITERKRTERELYESEERLNLLMNNTPVMLYALDKDLRVTFARGEILERLNYRADEVLGHPVHEIAKNFPIIIENMERARQGTATTFTMSQPPFTFLVMATPLIDRQGQIAGVAGAVTDITQEHLTEQALREAVNQLVLQYETSRALLAANTVEDLLRAFAKRVVEVENGHAALCYIRSDISGVPDLIELAALVSPVNTPSLVPEGKFTYQIMSSTMFSRLQSSLYQMIVISDIDNEQEHITEAHRQMIKQLGVKSFAIIPLNLHEKWMGIVAMAWSTPREFKLEERQYYETMAPQFAAALESLLLFQEIERALDENHRLLMEASYNEDLLRRFVEHMPLAIAMFDTDMRYLVANRRWQTSYRLGDIDIIGRTHYEVFPEITERWKELHRRCLAGEILHHEADPFERADGTIDWIRWEIRPWFTFEGKIGGIIMYTEVINERIRQQKERDAFIAELRVANQKATEASRMKSEFLATMSHELRTPLNTIIGFSGIMLEGIAGSFDDTTRHMISAMYESGENLLGLINDLLDISKIEAGWFELVPTPIEVSRMVTGWEASLQGYAAKKNLNSNTSIADNLPQSLIGDQDRITQIVNNLLSNAFKFTETGEVTLAVRWEEKTFIIEVSDTGIGIPEEALTYIFEAFRQVDSSTRRRYGGTGLGLSIVRRLVETMGGWIKVHSKLNEGSTFTVSLPLQER